MLNIFLQISDLIAPPHESIAVLRKETNDTFLRFFSPQKITGIVALSTYSNSLIRASITANKFHNYHASAKLLANLLNHWLCTLPNKPTVIVPIPLSKQRQKERGYNQVTRVLENLPNKNFEILTFLDRHKDTVPQTSLTRGERFKNMVDVFSLNHNSKDLSGYRIIIIDDVTTTGATLRSALLTLKPNIPPDCEIICLALAH